MGIGLTQNTQVLSTWSVSLPITWYAKHHESTQWALKSLDILLPDFWSPSESRIAFVSKPLSVNNIQRFWISA
jgi:hypothetical protein